MWVLLAVTLAATGSDETARPDKQRQKYVSAGTQATTANGATAVTHSSGAASSSGGAPIPRVPETTPFNHLPSESPDFGAFLTGAERQWERVVRSSSNDASPLYLVMRLTRWSRRSLGGIVALTLAPEEFPVGAGSYATRTSGALRLGNFVVLGRTLPIKHDEIRDVTTRVTQSLARIGIPRVSLAHAQQLAADGFLPYTDVWAHEWTARYPRGRRDIPNYLLAKYQALQYKAMGARMRAEGMTSLARIIRHLVSVDHITFSPPTPGIAARMEFDFLEYTGEMGHREYMRLRDVQLLSLMSMNIPVMLQARSVFAEQAVNPSLQGEMLSIDEPVPVLVPFSLIDSLSLHPGMYAWIWPLLTASRAAAVPLGPNSHQESLDYLSELCRLEHASDPCWAAAYGAVAEGSSDEGYEDAPPRLPGRRPTFVGADTVPGAEADDRPAPVERAHSAATTSRIVRIRRRVDDERGLGNVRTPRNAVSPCPRLPW